MTHAGALGRPEQRSWFDRNSEVLYKKPCTQDTSPCLAKTTGQMQTGYGSAQGSATARARAPPRDEEAPMSTGDILTKRDVAELLQVSERTVERWISEGSIPYVPLPKRGAWSEARFLRSEIVDWMRKRTVRPVRVHHGVANAQSA
jgi:excisionase family DNA binding protein